MFYIKLNKYMPNESLVCSKDIKRPLNAMNMYRKVFNRGQTVDAMVFSMWLVLMTKFMEYLFLQKYLQLLAIRR